MRSIFAAQFVFCLVANADAPNSTPTEFESRIAPILARRCLSCHDDTTRKGGYSLQTQTTAFAGGKNGPAIVPGDPNSSYLLDLVTPTAGHAEMPKDADPLTDVQVQAIRVWIEKGAIWPAGLRVEEKRLAADTDWWSFRPLTKPAVPQRVGAWGRNAIDAFVARKHAELSLTASAEADRRTLIRRLSYDLLGLPPTPQEVDAFASDADPNAYEKLVDRLLQSPHYGERWARHWLDIVHYGDTHGYDKDKPRPNAWPYRDYVIRALNNDVPYGPFLKEQIAGDYLYPERPEAIVATGFLAAGPWDFISHVEVPESKIDGMFARSMDRDDMVRTVMETCTSITVGCARCHHHKFDPIGQEDYYSLQAVFAAVDRADRPFDADPKVTATRHALTQSLRRLADERKANEAALLKAVGPELNKINQEIESASRQSRMKDRPEFGYHSLIEPKADGLKWVQVDLGSSQKMDRLTLVGCHDDFAGIGAGFGFPVRWKLEISNDATFANDTTVVADYSLSDYANPGVRPLEFSAGGKVARYVRVTATKLAHRQNDYIFALAELQVFNALGANLAAGKPITALDSIEAPVRWQRQNLVDGIYPGVASDPSTQKRLADLYANRDQLLATRAPKELREREKGIDSELAAAQQALKKLPTPQQVYAAATEFAPQGAFTPTFGKPREIRLLKRGVITAPGELARPGAPPFLSLGPAPFDLPANHGEGQRRARLAEWITDPRNPLTWRSIVNRVWQYHFGRGLVDTPNDFGRMGQQPTHPELLDWLAVEFRDHGQSLKNLHRLICCSATYRQLSKDRPELARVDSDNRYLWRMNRRRLEAEAVRDAVLFVSGKLNPTLYGPAFQDFLVDKPEHSPHYEYHRHDPADPASHRRSIYRFLVRSQPQPFMRTLDCADPSMQVEKRSETNTALQALALLNNPFMVTMADFFGRRVETLAPDRRQQIESAFRLALSRAPTPQEVDRLVAYSQRHGLANTCRLLFNLNEFVYID